MASLNEYQALGAAATVSNDQWQKHALNKMSAGYLLLISNNRNLARFYKSELEIENCPYKIAKRLLNQGYLEEAGENERGVLYRLNESKKDEVALTKRPPEKHTEKAKKDFDDEEVEEEFDFDDELLDESSKDEDKEESEDDKRNDFEDDSEDNQDAT